MFAHRLCNDMCGSSACSMCTPTCVGTIVSGSACQSNGESNMCCTFVHAPVDFACIRQPAPRADGLCRHAACEQRVAGWLGA